MLTPPRTPAECFAAIAAGRAWLERMNDARPWVTAQNTRRTTPELAESRMAGIHRLSGATIHHILQHEEGAES